MNRSVSAKHVPRVRRRAGQIGLAHWPDGLSLPIAVVSLEPEDIRRLQRIEFEDSSDGLDYIKAAILRLPSGALTALVRHINSPSPGTEIWVQERSTDGRSILNQLLTHLGIDPKLVSWKHPALA